MRDVGILPVLKDRQHEDDAADGQVIPRGHSQIEVAVQKRIDQRDKAERGNKPVGERDLAFLARKKPAERKRCYTKAEQQIFPQRFENTVIERNQNKRRDHQPQAQN